jgi:O-antigen/teichoic acid export membrane protein
MIQATLGTLGTLAGAGLGMTITKYVAETSVPDRGRAGQIIALTFVSSAVSGVGISILAFLLAPWLSGSILADSNLANPLRISSALVLFGAYNGVQFGALAGLQAFKAVALATLATSGISSLCTILGAYTGGLAGACVGLTLGAAGSCVIGRVFLGKEMKRVNVRPSYSGIWRHRNILLSFSLPALVCGLLVDPVNWICAALIIHQTDGYHQLGAFYAANQWLTALLFIPNLVAYVVFPHLSQAFVQHGRRHVSKILALSIGFNAAICIPLVLVLSLGSASIMGLYSPALVSEWKVLDMTLITGALIAIAVPIGQAIAASGRMWIGAALNTAWAVAYIAFTVLLARNGAFGLASARALAYGLHAIWSSATVVWLTKSRWT